MRRRVLAALATLSAVVFPAAAAEFIPGWKSDVVWDSNVLRTDINTESDFSFRNGPTLRFRELQGNLTYDANYQLTYEAFTRLHGINEFDQYFTGQSAWRATPTTTFTFNDDFAYTSSLNAIFGTGTAGQVLVVSPNRQRITTNGGHISMTQRLGPLWQLTLSGDNQYYNYHDPLQTDSLSTTGTAQMTRSFTPRLVAGGGLRFQRQDFGGTTLSSQSGTSFYQAFGVMQYNISPTLSFVAQGGPAYAVPDQPAALTTQASRSYFTIIPSTCKQRSPTGTPLFEPTTNNPQGDCLASVFVRRDNGQIIPPRTPLALPSNPTIDIPFVGEQPTLNSSLNYFGRLSLEKDWRLWHATVSFERSASNGSGLGTSTNLDTFAGELKWRPTEKWDVTLSSSYSTQSAISAGTGRVFSVAQRVAFGSAQITNPDGTVSVVPVAGFVGIPLDASLGAKLNNAYDVTSYLTELRAERRISRRLTLDGSFSWFQQKNNGAAIVASNQTIFRVVVGFTWNFDPIPL